MSIECRSRLQGMLPIAAVIATAFLLAGCFGDNGSWRGKDISGLMPELAFELTDTSFRRWLSRPSRQAGRPPLSG